MSCSETLAAMKKVLEAGVFDEKGEADAVNKVRFGLVTDFIPCKLVIVKLPKLLAFSVP